MSIFKTILLGFISSMIAEVLWDILKVIFKPKSNPQVNCPTAA